MKHIQNFIIEKFKLNSKTIETNKQNNKKNLITNLSKILNISYNQCEDICNKYYFVDPCKFFNLFDTDDDCLLCTPLEALLMIAVMLIDDYYPMHRYIDLGMMDYKGRNNPYDYSWFEENTDDGDFLDTVKKWIKNNQKEFSEIFKITEKSKLKKSDDVFELCENF